ncbi:hypothetical protein EBI_25667, partial [Enterocytozoon bieneusi H348]
MKISIAPHHANHNVEKDPHLTDYENYELKPDVPDKYAITKSIGKGKYSEVFWNNTIIIRDQRKRR